MIGEKLLELTILSTIMGISSFFAGLFPLKLTLSSNGTNFISLLSMGILVGTSLILIIPEGIEKLYNSIREEDIAIAPKYIGLSLLLGFMLMYVTDNASVILSSLNVSFNMKYSDLNGATSSEIKINDSIKSVLGSSLTLGLIFHSLIDGISLGSSFSQADTTIGLIFFLVIILHKLPTAFSLTSILIKENLNPIIIKVHLLIFSLVTPLSSLLSYLFLLLFKMNNDFVIGILFLFSGGTFVYVVIHVMIEVINGGDLSAFPPQSNDSDETLYHSHNNLSGLELLISLTGMSIPILLSLMGEH